MKKDDMGIVKRICLVFLVVFFCIGCDQATKVVAKESLVSSPPISFLSNTLRLQYVENTGAFLSLGSSLADQTRFWLFTVFTGFMLGGMLIFVLMSRKLSSGNIAAFSLIIGGGFSNLFDRLFNEGAVVDFMNIGIGSIRTGVFNLADVSVMVGVGLLVLFGTRHGNHSNKPSN